MIIFRRSCLPGLLLALALSACAVTPSLPAPANPFPTPGPVGLQPIVYPLEQGWVAGQLVRYYNLGRNTPLSSSDPERVQISPVWVLATGLNQDGSPIKVEGQGGLFDVAPGDPAYTDLWQVFTLTPPAAYQPDTLRSLADIEAAHLLPEKQAMLVNCPIVPAGSSLADGSRALTHGWVRGQPVFYFDFGPTNPLPGRLYAVITGFDAAGNPQLVSGQHLIFSAARGREGYSDFWQVYWVQAEPGYRADTLRSADALDPARVTASEWVVNYPQQ